MLNSNRNITKAILADFQDHAYSKGYDRGRKDINLELLAAAERQLANIERWLETGEPAGPEESKAIYEALKVAVTNLKGGLD